MILARMLRTIRNISHVSSNFTSILDRSCVVLFFGIILAVIFRFFWLGKSSTV